MCYDKQQLPYQLLCYEVPLHGWTSKQPSKKHDGN